MDANKHLSVAIFLAVMLLVSACSRGGGTIRHGNLSYNADEVFEREPSALALAKAAGRGDVSEINRMITEGTKVNTLGKHGITPLWWAAWAVNYEGFNALLEKGADPNAPRSLGLPVMHLAAQLPDARFLAAALKHGGNPDAIDQVSSDTPLFVTVLFHLEEQTGLLLKAGANVNVQQPISGWSLPMQAIGSNGDYKLVYELLQRGADYSLKMSNGQTLIDVIGTAAIDPNGEQYLWREKVIEQLRSKGVKVERPVRETPRTK